MPPPVPRSAAESLAPYALPPELKAEMRGWALLAVGALAVAGGLALLLGLSRAPGAQAVLPWDLATFFRTALVTHVVYSVVIWYLAVLGGLAVVAAARAGADSRAPQGMGRAGLWFAWIGALLLLPPTLLNQGEPSLNNYVPVLVHPLYYMGLGLLAFGVALPVLRLLARPAALGDALSFGALICGLVYLVALLCFVLAWVSLPAGGDAANLNERLFWGGGHVLQFVNTGLMLIFWQVLAEQVFGAPPLSLPLYRLSLGALLLFALPGPVVYGLYDVMSLAHRDAFTELLWYGLSLPPLVFSLGLALLVWPRRRALPWDEPRFLALALSVLVFNLGGIMGFFLGVSDTRTPSHYHLVITGVNLALLGGFVGLVLPLLDRPLRGRLMPRLAFWLYAGGQTAWSVAMFLAGLSGVPRKTVGLEQGLASIGQKILLGIVGGGAVIAVGGGVIFLALLLGRLLGRRRHG